MSNDGLPIRLVLTDADIVAKLSLWGLFSDLPTALQCEWRDIATLSSLVHRAHRARSKPDKLFPSAQVAGYALTSLRLMRALPEPAAEVVGLLQDSPQIDAGEAVLIGVACTVPSAKLATGDKRALLQLTQPEYAAVAAAIAGRIVCLEQLLIAFIDRLGFNSVREGISKSRDADKAIANCFGGQNEASEENARAGLRSYSNALRQQTGNLLVEGLTTSISTARS